MRTDLLLDAAPGLGGRAVLLVTLLAAASLAFWLARRRAGTFRAVRERDDGAGGVDGAPGAAPRLTGADLGLPLGARATLVQLSTATCATCPGVRRVLGALAAEHDGVRHVDVDAEERLDLVRRFDVRRTPTVLLLDADGVVRSRASGPLAAAQAQAALDDVLATPDPTTARSPR